MSGLLLASCHTTRPEWSETVKVAGVIGLAAAAVTSLVAGIHYLCTPTDEQLASSAQSDLKSINVRYLPALEAFDTHLYNTSGYGLEQCVSNSGNVPTVALELFLYQISTSLWQKNVSEALYRRELRDAVSLLVDYRHKLIGRICKLETKNTLTYQELAVLQTMRSVVEGIANYLPYLQTFKNLMEAHAPFFELAQIEWNVAKEYSQEISAVETYKYNAYALNAQLDRIVRSKKYSSKYEYISYVNSVESRLSALRKARNACKYMYASRFEWVDALMQNLEYIRAAVDVAYKAQLLQKQRDDIEAERKKLEQERIRLQQQYYHNQAQQFDMQNKWERRCKELDATLVRVNNELLQHEQVITQLQVNITI